MICRIQEQALTPVLDTNLPSLPVERQQRGSSPIIYALPLDTWVGSISLQEPSISDQIHKGAGPSLHPTELTGKGHGYPQMGIIQPFLDLYTEVQQTMSQCVHTSPGAGTPSDQPMPTFTHRISTLNGKV